jgi:N-acetylglucosaminyldiphosphoundecaprenol N-acetyl-beta-D-mannosaminyltransferase
MGLLTKKILGINVTISSKEKILEEIKKCFKKIQNPPSKIHNREIKPLIIFTPNPEIITYAQNDPMFTQIVNSAQINIPDGQGVCWAIKKVYNLSIEKIPGTNFMLELCKIAAKKSLRVGLIGGKAKVALQTSECLQRDYNFSQIEVFPSPEIILGKKKEKYRNIPNTKYLILYMKEKQDLETEKYFEILAKEIVNKKISILFVAFGFPKQEIFIHLLYQQLLITNYQLPIIVMSVGGAFDYLSGRVPRAPMGMRERGLEWLYRLIREPWRLPRQLKGAEFFYKVLTS